MTSWTPRSVERRSAPFGVWLSVVLPALFVAALTACGDSPPRDLSGLVVVDSLYTDPASGLPYSGPVYRAFPDSPERNQIEAALLDGEWEGEMRVYHPNGRIRYMGSFARGERCGAWTENADSVSTERAYDMLIRDIESLGMYPPCPER